MGLRSPIYCYPTEMDMQKGRGVRITRAGRYKGAFRVKVLETGLWISEPHTIYSDTEPYARTYWYDNI